MIQQYTSSLSKFPGRGNLITMETIFKYILFAIIAMVTNIGSQEAFITVYQGTNSLSYSVAIGTIIGLLVKYILDKRFIFNFHAVNKIHTTRTFLLYSLIGKPNIFNRACDSSAVSAVVTTVKFIPLIPFTLS